MMNHRTSTSHTSPRSTHARLAEILFALSLTLACAGPSISAGQPLLASASAYSLWEAAGEPEQGKDDPAYETYRAGYNLILEEEWDAARKKFLEVATKFPSSAYADDAEYWSAYALKHTDPAKARKAYEAFIAKYPESSFYDDAVADMEEGEAQSVTVTVAGDAPMALRKFKGGYSYGVGPNMRRAELQMRRAERQLGTTWAKTPMPGISPAIPFSLLLPDEELDERTQLKLDAIQALGESPDEKSFAVLKEIALDMTQHRRLRIAAMDALVEYKKFDVAPIFLEIAKNDTSAELQNWAIDFVTQHGKDKNKSLTLLIDLFRALPASKKGQRDMILYSIAEVGNQKAVEFLASVARTHEDYSLRRDAIYYLGNIGGENARAALYDVLRTK